MRIYPWNRFRGIEITTNFDVTSNNGKPRDYMLDIVAPDIKNDNTFYTDSNGLFMLKRVVNKREDFSPLYTENDRTSGNFYPMVALSYIQD